MVMRDLGRRIKWTARHRLLHRSRAPSRVFQQAVLVHGTSLNSTSALPEVGEASVGLQYILVIWDVVGFRQKLSDRPHVPRPR